MDERKIWVWQWVVFMVLWLGYGSTYLLRKTLGVVKVDLQNELNVLPGNLGWTDTALLLPYAVVSLTLSSLGDRLGPRLTLAVGLVVAAAATAPMGLVESFSPFLVLLSVSGASQAMCWPACCALLSSWFSDASRNSVFGLFSTCCFVGGLAGTGLAVWLQAAQGWRAIFLPPASCAAVLGVLVWVLGKDPGDCGLVVPGRAAATQAKTSSEARSSLLAVWRIPLIPEISSAMFCVKFVRYALMFWLPLYLVRSLGYSQVNAGVASTAFEVGGVVGSAVIGLVVDRCMAGRAILTSFISVAGSALALLAFVVTASYGLVLHIIFLVVAGALNCGPDVLLAGAVAADIGEREGGAAAAVAGVVNGMGSLGTVLEGPLVALTAAYFGWHTLMLLMVLVSGLGALAVLRAHIVQVKIQNYTKMTIIP